MSIVAESYRFVVGVDTHAATHTYSIIESPSREHVGTQTFPTTSAGLSRAEDWIGRRTAGMVDDVLISAEGTGSYGQIMGERLAKIGYRVVEAPTPSMKCLRGKGKTDSLDALNAANNTTIMSMDALRDRRGSQIQTALKVLSSGRGQMVAARLRAINALTALVRSYDLGIDARRALTATEIRAVGSWRKRREDLATSVARGEAIRLAKTVTSLDHDLKVNRDQLSELVTENAPNLLAMHGIGPITAAAIITVWSHPGRIRTEAALAMIAGTCPIPASSGNTTRHRLNRGGDRQLNKAIHTIALTRMRSDPATRDYVAKRTAEGLTKREIIRCLKRYITRQIHRTLTTPTTT